MGLLVPAVQSLRRSIRLLTPTGCIRRRSTEDKPALPQAPASFYCPVSMELMSDPVMVATGHTYDRSCIEKWLAQGNRTCPVTGMRLRHLELVPNHALRNAIQVTLHVAIWQGQKTSFAECIF